MEANAGEDPTSSQNPARDEDAEGSPPSGDSAALASESLPSGDGTDVPLSRRGIPCNVPDGSDANMAKELRPTDVLIGRGAAINAYSGNVAYRHIVGSHRPVYQQASSHRPKHVVAKDVIQEIKDSDGRFLQRIEPSGGKEDKKPLAESSWRIIPHDDPNVLEKVKQALREKGRNNDAMNGVIGQLDSRHLGLDLPNQQAAAAAADGGDQATILGHSNVQGMPYDPSHTGGYVYQVDELTRLQLVEQVELASAMQHAASASAQLANLNALRLIGQLTATHAAPSAPAPRRPTTLELLLHQQELQRQNDSLLAALQSPSMHATLGANVGATRDLQSAFPLTLGSAVAGQPLSPPIFPGAVPPHPHSYNHESDGQLLAAATAVALQNTHTFLQAEQQQRQHESFAAAAGLASTANAATRASLAAALAPAPLALPIMAAEQHLQQHGLPWDALASQSFPAGMAMLPQGESPNNGFSNDTVATYLSRQLSRTTHEESLLQSAAAGALPSALASESTWSSNSTRPESTMAPPTAAATSANGDRSTRTSPTRTTLSPSHHTNNEGNADAPEYSPWPAHKRRRSR